MLGPEAVPSKKRGADPESMPDLPSKRHGLTGDHQNKDVDATTEDSSTIVGEVSDIADMRDVDEDGFKLVSHRKHRTVGVPVLVTPCEAGADLRRLNPIMLYGALQVVLSTAPARSRFTSQGALLVDVATEGDVNVLLQCEELCGVRVCSRIPNAYQKNTCVIKGVPRWYTDEELLDFLRPQGVLHARRIVIRVKRPGGDWESKPTESVVLTFVPNTERPEKVNLGFTRHGVAEYTEPPPRCYKCQRYGHVAKYCQGELRCKRCAGAHDYKTCKADSSCANCGNSHPASFKGCPSRGAAVRRKQAFIAGSKPAAGQLRVIKSAEPPSVAGPGGQVPTSATASVKPTQNDETGKRDSAVDPLIPAAGASSSLQDSAPIVTKQQQRPSYVTALQRTRTSVEEEETDNCVEILRALFAALRAHLATMPSGSAKSLIAAVLALESVVLGASAGPTHA